MRPPFFDMGKGMLEWGIPFDFNRRSKDGRQRRFQLLAEFRDEAAVLGIFAPKRFQFPKTSARVFVHTSASV